MPEFTNDSSIFGSGAISKNESFSAFGALFGTNTELSYEEELPQMYEAHMPAYYKSNDEENNARQNFEDYDIPINFNIFARNDDTFSDTETFSKLFNA